MFFARTDYWLNLCRWFSTNFCFQFVSGAALEQLKACCFRDKDGVNFPNAYIQTSFTVMQTTPQKGPDHPMTTYRVV